MESEEVKIAKCKRCGRPLKSDKAIELGMGEVCWRKYLKSSNHKKLIKQENCT